LEQQQHQTKPNQTKPNQKNFKNNFFFSFINKKEKRRKKIQKKKKNFKNVQTMKQINGKKSQEFHSVIIAVWIRKFEEMKLGLERKKARKQANQKYLTGDRTLLWQFFIFFIFYAKPLLFLFQ